MHKIWSSLYLLYVIVFISCIYIRFGNIKLYGQIYVNVWHQVDANSWCQCDVDITDTFIFHLWSVDINCWHHFDVKSTCFAHCVGYSYWKWMPYNTIFNVVCIHLKKNEIYCINIMFCSLKCKQFSQSPPDKELS